MISLTSIGINPYDFQRISGGSRHSGSVSVGFNRRDKTLLLRTEFAFVVFALDERCVIVTDEQQVRSAGRTALNGSEVD
jgi:hypothetical protein